MGDRSLQHSVFIIESKLENIGSIAGIIGRKGRREI